ncbi:hypothetical protein CCMA1212_003237 [Trichoderma ghanense]|uniref:Uncharacterized protein n=1 Tax=Trichoderma ghanense TaxID=65468 RepID=A0ABY2HAB2_9HYPO
MKRFAGLCEVTRVSSAAARPPSHNKMPLRSHPKPPSTCSAGTSDPWFHVELGGQKSQHLGDFQPPQPVGFDGVTGERLSRRNGARLSDLRWATACHTLSSTPRALLALLDMTGGRCLPPPTGQAKASWSAA